MKEDVGGKKALESSLPQRFFSENYAVYIIYLFVCLLLSILGFYGGDGAGVCIE